MEAWKIEKIKSIADRAIEEAKKVMAAGAYVIEMGDAVNAEGITGYNARRMDGEVVSARISAQVTVRRAKAEIYKLGMKGKQLQPEASAELKRLTAVWDELELDDPDEE